VIRVLVADDHVFYREGIKAMLEGHPEVTVVGEAGDGAEAVRLVGALAADVVLMDLRMPGTGGIEATRQLTVAHPGVAVLVLTVSDDDSVFAAVRAGARGYLLKHATVDDLVRAVHAVHRGEAIFSPSIAQRVLGFVADSAHRPTVVLPELTQREHDVLELIAHGLTNGQIATRLDLTTKTVRNYVSGILAKLHVHDRAAAAARAREVGLTGRDGPAEPR
jgi:DNA-binding NarL/FixJ family response regulator